MLFFPDVVCKILVGAYPSCKACSSEVEGVSVVPLPPYWEQLGHQSLWGQPSSPAGGRDHEVAAEIWNKNQRNDAKTLACFCL